VFGVVSARPVIIVSSAGIAASNHSYLAQGYVRLGPGTATFSARSACTRIRLQDVAPCP
jgi:hypothetical protein